MLATLNIVTNPFHPTLDRVQKPIQRKVKINTLVNRHKINLDKPVVCYYNGEAVLRKQWSKIVVGDKDVVSFVYLPQGGGGSNPLRLILMIGMMAFAPYLAGLIAPSLGIAAGSMGMSILSSAIGFLGNQLINALIPPPQPPKSQQQASMAAPSPTYSIGAQGNQARIGQAIPVLYGTMKMYPDFAAQPYAEYENNEQYLYQLFCVSQGSVSLNEGQIYIEDSQINSFGMDYQVEFVQPNTSSTLFPIDVYNVSEVSGSEMLDMAIGPFVANPATTTVKKLAFDVVLPRGLSYINDEGGLEARSVNFSFYAQKINDAGADIGLQFTLGSEIITAATSTPIRKTYKYDVTPGRYKISALRTNAKDTNQRVSNDLMWSSARGYSAGTRNYGDVTLLAVKLKATNSISSQSSRKINIIGTRKIEIPSLNITLDGYDWSARTGTQSIAWAIADMCRAAYGAGVTEARFDVGQLIALDAIWTSRGDKLNCVFDSTQTFWEALCMACRAGRCRPYVQGGMIHFVRDAVQVLPTAMFTSRNIVKGSFKITYIMPSADNADCVDVEYFDEVIWKPRVVRAELDVGVKTKPAKVKAFGITNRAQAYKEGMYIASNNRYRRKEISFETELEGHIPALGDLIGIQSDIPEWGQHGEVMSVTAVTGTTSKITSSEPFVWTPAVTHYAMLRRADGSANGPIVVTQGANEYELIYTNADVDFSIYSGFDKEKTHISFGRTGQVIQLARVLSTTPQGNTVRVSAINEDARVHSADGTAVPVDTYEWSLTTPKIKPTLAGFTISQTGSGVTPSISLSWLPAAGASRYIIETSTDNTNWSTLAEITGNSYNFIANVGMLYVRIAAFGGVIGPYITNSINVGLIAPPPNVIAGTISTNGQSYNINWTPVSDCDGYYVEVLNATAVKRSFNTTTTNFDYTLENGLADGGPWRTIDVKIKAFKGNVLSQTAYTLTGTNAAPVAPTLTIVPGAENLSISVSKSNEIDYAGTLIYASDTTGFTPAPGNLIYSGVGNFFLARTIVPLFIKAAHYDIYGTTGLNYSTEYSATPLSGSVGPAGNPGDSYRVAYAVASTAALGTVPATVTTSGSTSFPATNSWGGAEVWSGAVTALAVNEFQHRIDGIYSPTTGDTVWGKPYQASLKVGSLSGISADLGSITAGSIALDTAGFIRAGQTAYGIGTGFFLGYSGAEYKFSLGNNTSGLTWDGSALSIAGIVNGPFTLNAGGHIKGGQTAYNTGVGFYLGYSGAAYKFSIGNPAGQFLTWDGSILSSNGLSALGGISIYETVGSFTFTVPSGVTKVYVALCIGGGGGGGATVGFDAQAGSPGSASSFGAYVTSAGGGAGNTVGAVAVLEGNRGFTPSSYYDGVSYTILDVGHGAGALNGSGGGFADEILSPTNRNATNFGAGGAGLVMTGLVSTYSGGGGGSGALKTWIPITGLTGGQMITVTVGAGGAGKVSASYGNGGNGKGGKVVVIW